jgi:phytoene synthase
MLSPSATIVQRHDPERFVTALFAPASLREVLFTLYAFNHELARAREVASVPMLALIRLQWWREVVEGAHKPHEVATPLRAAIAAGALDPAALDRMIEARTLEAEETLDEAQFEAYLRGTGGALMREAGRLLGAPACGDDLEQRGAGCAAAGALRNHSAHAAIGRWSFPAGRDAAWCRAEASRLLAVPRRWPPEAVPAALPAIFARRALHRGARLDPLAKLAVWAAAQRRVC